MTTHIAVHVAQAAAEQLQKERAEKQKTVSELTKARNELARIQSELLDSKVKAMTQQKETMVVTLEVAAQM